jgi:hypothetical protein
MHNDTSKTDTEDNDDQPADSSTQTPQRTSGWQIRQHVARGVAYGVGSGAVSLLVLWVQTRY